MENNKYYTPTIEEFHVGFEFEYKPKSGPWVKINYNNWMSPNKGMKLDFCTEQELLRKFDIIDQSIKRKDVRCKYLDQEDIESLGWKHVGSLWFEKDYYKLRKWKKQSLDIYYIYPNGEEIILFRGTIKNKSQLKFIMTCLGILE